LLIRLLSPDFMVVESIPQNVNLTTQYSTYDSWMSLIGSARKSIDIASFYWNMEEGRLYPNNSKKKLVVIWRIVIVNSELHLDRWVDGHELFRRSYLREPK
jgi:hypothetical protein